MIPRPLFIAVLLTLAAGSPAEAQTCRTETEVPSTTPASRFLKHGNGTVTDTVSGLMWAQCAEGLSGSACTVGMATTLTWEAALIRARDSGLAGYTDWRLPNIKELSSIVEERCGIPAINLAVFPAPDPSTLTGSFWSASGVASSPQFAWSVRFLDGFTAASIRDFHYERVRLVRSGQ